MNHDHAREFNPPTVVIGKVGKRKHHLTRPWAPAQLVLPQLPLVPIILISQLPPVSGAGDVDVNVTNN